MHAVVTENSIKNNGMQIKALMILLCVCPSELYICTLWSNSRKIVADGVERVNNWVATGKYSEMDCHP